MKRTGRSRLEAKLKAAPLRYFSASELLFLGGSHYSGRAKNTEVPWGLVPTLISIAEGADEARHRLQAPVKVISAYRDPNYNAKIGGARNSYHKKAKALDLMPVDPAKLPRLKEIVLRLQAEGKVGGVGFYSSFVHIDSGPRRRWGR